jgi:hypothetical protein
MPYVITAKGVNISTPTLTDADDVYTRISSEMLDGDTVKLIKMVGHVEKVIRTYTRPTQADREAEVVKALERYINNLELQRGVIVRLAERLTDPSLYPSESLQWADSAFAAAADLQVAAYLRQLTPMHAAEFRKLATMLGSELVRRASYPEKSSSSCSNVLSLELAASFARAYQTVEEWASYAENGR